MPTPLLRGKNGPTISGSFNVIPCGILCFLAEYQLEHKIEKDKEKKYMRSLIEDLKADTSAIVILNGSA
jgi:hypothetical protein